MNALAIFEAQLVQLVPKSDFFVLDVDQVLEAATEEGERFIPVIFRFF